MNHSTLTVDQRKTFAESGVLRLVGLLPQEIVRSARDAVLQVLAKRGLWRDGAWRFSELPPEQQPAPGTNLLKEESAPLTALAALITPSLLQTVSVLVEGRAVRPMTAPQLLFTLPNAITWAVPHQLWHLDIPRLPEGGIPGIQLFTFLDTVAPEGGGTLVVAGSHRLLNNGERLSSAQVKQRLLREPFFRDVMTADSSDRSRFLRESSFVGDVKLQVVEMHGAAGDVFVMDMRLLHVVAPNAALLPRMMVTQRFVLETLFEQISGAEVPSTDPHSAVPSSCRPR